MWRIQCRKLAQTPGGLRVSAVEEPLFENLVTQKRSLKSGQEINLPVRYRHTRAIVGHFTAPIANVRKLLPTPYLTPTLFLPGKAIVSVAAMEYTEISDVEAYNEVSIMIPVQYRPAINFPGLPLLFHNWFGTFGFYILHLPVTTQEACEFGIEFWGYPKFVADISFEETSNSRTCRLATGGDEILSLSVPKSAVKRCRKSYYTYTVQEGKLLRTRVDTDEKSTTKRLLRRASLSFGTHNIGKELASLNLGNQSVEYSYAPEANSVLYGHSQEFPLTD